MAFEKNKEVYRRAKDVGESSRYVAKEKKKVSSRDVELNSDE